MAARCWAQLLLATWAGATEPDTQAPQPSASPRKADPWTDARLRLVQYEVVAAGVKDTRVCDAMRATPRHEFVPAALRRYAYYDIGMPIGDGQTISSPFIVAYMTEQLQPQPTDKVLEIGTGSGYQAAVLSGLVSEVYSIEIVEALGRRAAKTLRRLGYDNVKTKIGDGYQGWPEHAPSTRSSSPARPRKFPSRSWSSFARAAAWWFPSGSATSKPCTSSEGQGGAQGRTFAAHLLRAHDGPRRGRASRARRAGRAGLGERRLPGRPGRSAGRLVLRPPGQGRAFRPDSGRQVSHSAKRYAGPRRAGHAGDQRRTAVARTRSKSPCGSADGGRNPVPCPSSSRA